MPYLPVFLRNLIYVDMSTPEKTIQNYEQLLRALFDKPRYDKPAIGKPPIHILDSVKPQSQTASKLFMLKDAVVQDKSIVPALVAEYLQAFSDNLSNYNLDLKVTETPLDELVNQNIESFLPQRDEFIDFLSFIMLYKQDSVIYQTIFEFYQSIIKYKYLPVDRTQSFDK